MKKFGVTVIVCLNKFETDTDEEVAAFKEHCEEMGYSYAISDAYLNGGEGAITLANKVLEAERGDFHYLYNVEDSVTDKIKKVCHEIYGAKDVHISDEILDKIAIFEKNGQPSTT